MQVNLPECLENLPTKTLKVGTYVFRAGDACQNFYFLLQGSIRVNLISSSGKEILLYQFGAGETCVLTTACLLSGDHYNAEAIVNSDVTAIVLPLEDFKVLLAESNVFRELVFTTFAHRISELMAKIDEVAFTSIDRRLATRLLGLSDASSQVRSTHDQLALDLGSAREVVSRKLAYWEKAGWLVRDRGSLRITNLEAIDKLSKSDH